MVRYGQLIKRLVEPASDAGRRQQSQARAVFHMCRLMRVADELWEERLALLLDVLCVAGKLGCVSGWLLSSSGLQSARAAAALC